MGKKASIQPTQTTATKTKQDGREQLRPCTPRSLAMLLILSSRTETMRWLGLNLCRAFQFSTPPTAALWDATLHSPDEAWIFISTALPAGWLVMGMERGHVVVARSSGLSEVMFAVSKHWHIQQKVEGREKIDMYSDGAADLRGIALQRWLRLSPLIFSLFIY